MRVLFVCLGNICRSPAAEGIMLELLRQRGLQHRYVVDSAGTSGWHRGDLPDRRMRLHARQRGLELTHHSRPVDVEDFSDFDLIIGMDAANVHDLRQMAPSVEAARRIVPMSRYFSPDSCRDHVPDPYYEGAEGFELVLDLLEDACARLLDELEAARG